MNCMKKVQIPYTECIRGVQYTVQSKTKKGKGEEGGSWTLVIRLDQILSLGWAHFHWYRVLPVVTGAENGSEMIPLPC